MLVKQLLNFDNTRTKVKYNMLLLFFVFLFYKSVQHLHGSWVCAINNRHKYKLRKSTDHFLVAKVFSCLLTQLRLSVCCIDNNLLNFGVLKKCETDFLTTIWSLLIVLYNYDEIVQLFASYF